MEVDDRIKWNKLTKPNTEAVWRTWKIGRKMAEAEEVESEEVAVQCALYQGEAIYFLVYVDAIAAHCIQNLPGSANIHWTGGRVIICGIVEFFIKPWRMHRWRTHHPVAITHKVFVFSAV